MLFKKKKRMIDVRELQKRGVVRIPKKDIVVPTNREGFVEFGTNGKPSTSETQPSTNSELFGFANMDSSPSTSSSDGYTKREADAKTVELDNKIYKLEQRIELLEKKLDITKPTESNIGPMGW
jgi:hypothetical protein